MLERKDPAFLPFLEAQEPPSGRWSKALKCYKEDVEHAISFLRAIEQSGQTTQESGEKESQGKSPAKSPETVE